MDNIIEVKNLSKHFGEVKAVNDISFEVKKGSMFAFLGLNGAGKSTTINVLTSIIKKDRGTVIIDGEDLDKHIRNIKKKIGIVFQGSVLDAELTVRQNLMSRASLYSLSRKQAEQRINYLTEILDLGSLLKRQYGTLSGGQKRRIDIARALINEPKILFLDEPTTGLDPNTRISVWKIIQNLIDEKGLTVFLTTHYMEEVVKADKVVIIDSGNIVANDTPDALKSRYTTDFIRVIAEKSERMDKLLESEEKSFEYKKNSYFIKAENSLDALEFVNRNKEIISDFEILKGDMDDVFLNVTGKKLEV